MPKRTIAQWPRDSNQKASDKPGAVQSTGCQLDADLRDDAPSDHPHPAGWTASPERWTLSDRNAGRLQIGTVGAISSEYLGGFRQNPHAVDKQVMPGSLYVAQSRKSGDGGHGAPRARTNYEQALVAPLPRFAWARRTLQREPMVLAKALPGSDLQL